MFQFPIIVFIIPIKKWIWKTPKCVFFTFRKFTSPSIVIIKLRMVTNTSDDKYWGFTNFTGSTFIPITRNVHKIIAIHIAAQLSFLSPLGSDFCHISGMVLATTSLLLILVSVKVPSFGSSQHPAQKYPKIKFSKISHFLVF